MSFHSQAKFKSLTVVSTFELGTEEGSVLQLTEASRWSEVGLETESENCGTSKGGSGLRAPVRFFRTEVSSLGSGQGVRSDKSEWWGPTASIPTSVSFLLVFYFAAGFATMLGEASWAKRCKQKTTLLPMQSLLEVIQSRPVLISLWILIGSVLGGLLLLALLVFCLWKVSTAVVGSMGHGAHELRNP